MCVRVLTELCACIDRAVCSVFRPITPTVSSGRTRMNIIISNASRVTQWAA